VEYRVNFTHLGACYSATGIQLQSSVNLAGVTETLLSLLGDRNNDFKLKILTRGVGDPLKRKKT
jgi:hypothetical protein